MSRKKKLIPELRFPEFKNSGGWNSDALGTLVEIKGRIGYRGYTTADIVEEGKGAITLSPSNFDKNGKLNFEKCTYISWDKYEESPEIMLEEGQTVLVKTASVGKSAYVESLPEKTTINPQIVVLKPQNIEPKFLAYTIFHNYVQTQIRDNVGAGAIPNMSQDSISKFEILLPPDNEGLEQQIISSCLSSLDDLIAAHNDKLEALKNHKKGLIHNLFPQEGQKVPNYRFPEFKDDGEWVSARLNEVAAISSGGTPSRAKKEYWNGNIPWVSTTLIDFNEIKKTKEFITPLGLENSSTKCFQKGTILMAMYGQGKTRGKVAILGLDATINQACAAITLKKDMDTNFVFQNLAARYKEIRSISNQGGQQNLSGEIIKNISIYHPNVKSSEQQKIASCLSAVDNLITAQTDKIEQLRQHKKGLMQGLFPKIES